MSRKFKFPDPKDYPAKTPMVMCPSERVMDLYNQENPQNKRQRMCSTVKEWFTAESLNKGWDGVGAVPEVETHHGSGCLLYQKHSANLSFAEEMKKLSD